MGVEILKPGEQHPDEGLSYEERQLKARRERRARVEAHQARDRAYQAERAGEKAAPGPPENKMLPADEAVPEDKAPEPPAEDLSGLKKPALRALAVERDVEVTRADGRTDLEPTVADYIRALGG